MYMRSKPDLLVWQYQDLAWVRFLFQLLWKRQIIQNRLNLEVCAIPLDLLRLLVVSNLQLEMLILFPCMRYLQAQQQDRVLNMRREK